MMWQVLEDDECSTKIISELQDVVLMLYKLYLVIMQYYIEMKDCGLNLNCNICNQYSRIPQRLKTVIIFSPTVCHFPSVSLNPFTHASLLNIFLVHQHSIFVVPSFSLLLFPHLLFLSILLLFSVMLQLSHFTFILCYATAVPFYFYSLLCYSCTILLLFSVMLQLYHFTFIPCYATAVPFYFLCYATAVPFYFYSVMLQLSHFTFILCYATAVPFSSSCFLSPAIVVCWHHVSNQSLHFYICYIDFFVLPFLVSSLGLSQCGSKNLIPEDLCYSEYYAAPIQLESKKKDEGDDHYTLSAENAHVSYS
jgi:hypothetical protein